MKIQIRFNTERLRALEKNLPAWRVLFDGQEKLAHHIELEVPCWTTMDEIAPGTLKWHITCEGVLHWDEKAEKLVIRKALNL